MRCGSQRAPPQAILSLHSLTVWLVAEERRLCVCTQNKSKTLRAWNTFWVFLGFFCFFRAFNLDFIPVGLCLKHIFTYQIPPIFFLHPSLSQEHIFWSHTHPKSSIKSLVCVNLVFRSKAKTCKWLGSKTCFDRSILELKDWFYGNSTKKVSPVSSSQSEWTKAMKATWNKMCLEDLNLTPYAHWRTMPDQCFHINLCTFQFWYSIMRKIYKSIYSLPTTTLPPKNVHTILFLHLMSVWCCGWLWEQLRGLVVLWRRSEHSLLSRFDLEQVLHAPAQKAQILSVKSVAGCR